MTRLEGETTLLLLAHFKKIKVELFWTYDEENTPFREGQNTGLRGRPRRDGIIGSLMQQDLQRTGADGEVSYVSK